MARVAANLLIGDIVKNYTMVVRLVGYRRWRLRARVGTAVLRIGARIIGLGFRLDIVDETKPVCERCGSRLVGCPMNMGSGGV